MQEMARFKAPAVTRCSERELHLPHLCTVRHPSLGYELRTSKVVLSLNYLPLRSNGLSRFSSLQPRVDHSAKFRQILRRPTFQLSVIDNPQPKQTLPLGAAAGGPEKVVFRWAAQ